MADISNVDTATIRDLYTRLESLPCKNTFTVVSIEPKLILSSSYHDPCSVLSGFCQKANPRVEFNQLKNLGPIPTGPLKGRGILNEAPETMSCAWIEPRNAVECISCE